jgi:Uma2 family endonuclease
MPRSIAVSRRVKSAARISQSIGENATRLDPDRIPTPYPPDIAVEILSRSATAIGLRHKVRDYLRFGSKEVCLVDHSDGEVQVCTNSGLRFLRESTWWNRHCCPDCAGYKGTPAGC